MIKKIVLHLNYNLLNWYDLSDNCAEFESEIELFDQNVDLKYRQPVRKFRNNILKMENWIMEL